MKKLAILAMAAVAAGALFLALSTGAAFADNAGGGTEWTCDDPAGAEAGAFCAPEDRTAIGPAADQVAPVGRNINEQGLNNGFLAHTGFGAFVAIVNNPLCPFHGVEATP